MSLPAFQKGLSAVFSSGLHPEAVLVLLYLASDVASGAEVPSADEVAEHLSLRPSSVLGVYDILCRKGLLLKNILTGSLRLQIEELLSGPSIEAGLSYVVAPESRQRTHTPLFTLLSRFASLRAKYARTTPLRHAQSLPQMRSLCRTYTKTVVETALEKFFLDGHYTKYVRGEQSRGPSVTLADFRKYLSSNYKATNAHK